MKIAVLIARILLGLIFVVFGLNFFFHFLPMPQPVMSDKHKPLVGAFTALVIFSSI